MCRRPCVNAGSSNARIMTRSSKGWSRIVGLVLRAGEALRADIVSSDGLRLPGRQGDARVLRGRPGENLVLPAAGRRTGLLTNWIMHSTLHWTEGQWEAVGGEDMPGQNGKPFGG